MTKKIISLILSATVAVSTILTGCSGASGGASSKASDPNTIVIWHDKEDAVADVLKKQLDTLSPDININLEKKTDLTESLKMVGDDPKSAPDMYIFAHDKIGVYAEMGILAPITDIIPKKDLTAYMDKTIEAAT